jgi:AcrR family transcriptional regulator
MPTPLSAVPVKRASVQVVRLVLGSIFESGFDRDDNGGWLMKKNQNSMTDKALATPMDGRHARSYLTRESIILTAERLFAENGIGNVSLRDISLAAGQKNNGAVQYHFRDRENLVVEVTKYRASLLEKIRGERLEKIASLMGEPKVRDYVSAFVDALASILDEDNYFLRFLSRLAIETGGTPEQAVSQESLTYLRAAMLKLMPHLSVDVLNHRWRIMTITTVHILAGYQAAIKAKTLGAPLSWLLSDLTNFLTAGLQAPVSE